MHFFGIFNSNRTLYNTEVAQKHILLWVCLPGLWATSSSVLWWTRGVTNRCRLPWLTNSALVYEPRCGGERGGGEVSCEHGAQICKLGDLTLWRDDIWWRLSALPTHIFYSYLITKPVGSCLYKKLNNKVTLYCTLLCVFSRDDSFDFRRLQLHI